jgi:hypothetical protein
MQGQPMPQAAKGRGGKLATTPTADFHLWQTVLKWVEGVFWMQGPNKRENKRQSFGD